MTDLVPSVLRCWSHQGEYADRLTADLTREQVFRAPPGGAVMNHPAWVLCHLGVYMPVLIELLGGGTPPDPLEHRYGRQSRPTLDPGDYPAWPEVRASYLAAHTRAGEALRAAPAGILDRPIAIPRWAPRWPRLGDAVVHLMVDHESVHLGQLSAWRRVMGLPSV